jgi:hypothetical protein
MTATGDFIVQYFPVFLLGAIFGKLMESSGSAEVLANAAIERLGSDRAMLAVVLSCAAMTYGGVSLFVVAFAVFPIAAAVFRRADIPKRLIPGTIALGAFTFTMTALPGTPAIQNAIPMPYFGTSPFAAPGLGIVTALIMFGLGQLWLERRARATSEGYGDHPIAHPPIAHPGPTGPCASAPPGKVSTSPNCRRSSARRTAAPPRGGTAAGCGDRHQSRLHRPRHPGHGHRLSCRAGIWRHDHRFGARHLVDHRRPGHLDPVDDRGELVAPAQADRLAGRRRQCLASADLQHRQPRRASAPSSPRCRPSR